ncbi:hypothetical protein L1887_36301 [Cichorium endivia]|nr:hypothetical protein L1887_36301 [Cichorium endivia]
MTEGRLLKSMQKQELDGVPSASLPVAEKKVVFPQSQGHGKSEPDSVTDFRPTTPGNSPGAGHSFTEHRLDTQSVATSDAPAVPESGAGNSDDFRPTGPGHSPGGGHSKDGHIATPNA